MNPRVLLFALSAVFLAPALRAWDYEGHRTVNQLALASLPDDFPKFVRTPANAERIAFLSGEPDRWRNVPDPIMKQSGGSWTDHFCDLEQLESAGLDLAKVPSFRFDFIVQFAAGRAAHADKFPAINPEKNNDHTAEWPGFAPWAITEYFARLRSAFSYLKVMEELGTPVEVANAQANAVYVMGVMGHYVGDCAQPLHTTIHHNGWVGENPKGYSKWPGIHSWIDGGFAAKAGIAAAQLTPRATPARLIPLAAREDGRDPMFVAVLDYLVAQNKLVEPLYQLEKNLKFSHSRDEAITPEGRAFIEGQLLVGGKMLGAIWLTAWKNAVPDTYLRTALTKRAGGAVEKKSAP
jgi:hypothetical protein